MYPVDPRLPTTAPVAQSSLGTPPAVSSVLVRDQISSVRPPEADVTVAGVKLYAKSAAALTLGVLPFTVAKSGQGMVKLSGLIAQYVETFFSELGIVGRFLGNGSRVILSISTLIGAFLLWSGSFGFSLTQQLIWGKVLVNHPQEERINTKLARYGAGQQPKVDFIEFISGFTRSSLFSPERQTFLSRMRSFEIS